MRLLLVEDDEPFAELTVRQLASEGIDCTWTRVATEQPFREALATEPDLIISDCSLPGFDGLTAFSIAASEAPDIPFVFVSGTLGDERAREALKRGAAGYVSKGDRKQLAQVVRRALQGAGSRRRATDHLPHRSLDSGTGAAQHLLARRTVLDITTRQADSMVSPGAAPISPGAAPMIPGVAPIIPGVVPITPGVATIIPGVVPTSSPSPGVLLAIEGPQTRERFARLLTAVSLDVDAFSDATEALECLAQNFHAVMFTDNLKLIRCARQLPAGATTHILYVGTADHLLETEALRAGANDCVPSDARGERLSAHLAITRHVADLAAALRLALHDNCILSTLDELTGAGRRHFFEAHFPREVERAARLGLPLAVVMCDIDHFKRINDRHGHQIGDLVLTEFVDRVTDNLRLGKDWVARLGGEEFAVVLPDTPASEAPMVADRLRESIHAQTFVKLAHEMRITASFGVCALDQVPDAVENLADRMMQAADAALYQSKRRGRNRVTIGQIGGTGHRVRFG